MPKVSVHNIEAEVGSVMNLALVKVSSTIELLLDTIQRQEEALLKLTEENKKLKKELENKEVEENKHELYDK